jgi:hypothetical protein
VSDYNGWDIGDDIKESLDRYVEHGIPTGGFLKAVLCNDLFGAVGRADHINIRNLQNICGYVYNEIPSTCWGSTEKVRAWFESKTAERQKERS